MQRLRMIRMAINSYVQNLDNKGNEKRVSKKAISTNHVLNRSYRNEKEHQRTEVQPHVVGMGFVIGCTIAVIRGTAANLQQLVSFANHGWYSNGHHSRDHAFHSFVDLANWHDKFCTYVVTIVML